MPLVPQSKASLFEPVPFDGKTPQFRPFAPDPRLDLQLTGTIELYFAFDPEEAAREGRADPFCLLANASESQLNWAILLDQGGSTIGISNGDRPVSLAFPFHDGLPHHVVFSTYGRITELIVDGRTLGFLEAGYGGGARLPLEIGSLNGSMVFRGLLHGLRLWKTPLTDDGVRKLKNYGRPPDDHPAITHLLGFSEFTPESRALAYVAPRPVPMTALGATDGSPFEAVVPAAHRVVEVQVRSSPEDGITAVELVVQGPDGAKATLADLAAARRSAEAALIPRPAARAAVWKAAVAVQSSLLVVHEALGGFAATSAAFAALVGDWEVYLQLAQLDQALDQPGFPSLELIQSALARFSGTAGIPVPAPRPLQLQGLIAAPAGPDIVLSNPEMEGAKRALAALVTVLQQARDGKIPPPALPPPAPLPKPAGTVSVLQTAGGEVLAGIAGTYDTRLRTLRLMTNVRVPDPLGTPGPVELERAFFHRLPAGAGFAGIHGVRNGAAITAIGLLFYEDSEPAGLRWTNPLLAAPALDLGVWQEATTRPPVRDDEGIRRRLKSAVEEERQRARIFIDEENKLHLHGNYEVYNAAPGGGDEVSLLYRLWLTAAGDLILAREDEQGQRALRHLGAGIFEEVSGARHLVFGEDGATFTWDTRTYRQPLPYQARSDEDTEIIPWGGTFSADQRPTLADFNFRGYHVGKIHHRNYQLGTGAGGYVFQWPADSSRDYIATTNGKIIPHGIHYCADQQAVEKAHAITVRSSREHHRAWNVNLGLSLGASEAASFGLNTSYQEELGTIVENETMYSVSFAKEVEYALVCDRGRVRLDPEFRAAVLALRDRHIAGAAVSFRQMVETFGTHYPFAVTYGGAAYQELTYTTEALTEMAGAGFTISGHASGTLEGVTIGANAGGGMNWSSKRAAERKVQDTSFRTIGGSFSFNGGWTLGHRSEVPLFLDLRPLPDLLSPVFFDDPAVWTTIRGGLAAEIARLPKLPLLEDFQISIFRVTPVKLRIRNETLLNGLDVSQTFGEQLGGLADVSGVLLDVAKAIGLPVGALDELVKQFGLPSLKDAIPILAGRGRISGSASVSAAENARIAGPSTVWALPPEDAVAIERVGELQIPATAFAVSTKVSAGVAELPVRVFWRNHLIPNREMTFVQPLTLTPGQHQVGFSHELSPENATVRIRQTLALTFQVDELPTP